MNKIIQIGRITHDLKLEKTKKDESVLNFSIAINYKDGAEFFPWVAFGNTADNLYKYTKKGSMIALEGHIKYLKYKEGTVYKNTVDKVTFLPSPQDKND